MTAGTSEKTVEQELAYAVHLAVKMMSEAYPGVAHEDMPPNAREFDRFIGSLMGEKAYQQFRQAALDAAAGGE